MKVSLESSLELPLKALGEGGIERRRYYNEEGSMMMDHL